MKGAMTMVAQLMALSARTAPKCLGQDYVDIIVLEGEDLNILADAMYKYGEETKKINFDRDAEGIRRSDAVLLISLKENKPLGLNCGACGSDRCSDLREKDGPEYSGPLCAWRVLDVGVALGSAVKTASILNADNRIMYRVGVVAKKIDLAKGAIVVGIPISASSKNIYFDRPEKK